MAEADLDTTQQLLHGLSYSLEEAPARGRERDLQEEEREQERERERERKMESERGLAWLHEREHGGGTVALRGETSRPTLSGVEESAEEGEEAEEEEEGEEAEEEEEGEAESRGDGGGGGGGGGDGGEDWLERGERDEDDDDVDDVDDDDDDDDVLLLYSDEAGELVDASYDEYGDETVSLGRGINNHNHHHHLARDPSVIDPDYLDDEEDEDY